MKKSYLSPLVFFALILGLVLLAVVAGCGNRGELGYLYANPVSNSPTPSSTDAGDKEIAQIKRKIADLQKYETEQRHIAVINEVADHKSRSWLKGDAQPEYGEVAETANQQVAATEKEIQQLKKQLARVQEEKDKALSLSSGCFPPETFVKLADGSFKPFVQIQPGDEVQTYDIGYGKVVSKPVIAVYVVDANHLYTINGTMMTTAGERVLSQEGWKAVRDLKNGDMVHVDGRMVEVARIEFRRVDRTLHNMQVGDTHNFYVVTADGSEFLVHNSGGGGGGGSK